MPRKREIARRPTQPDPVYGSELLAKFINHLMTRGKKSLAEQIVYGALEVIQSRLHREPLPVLEKALRHIQPLVEVKSRRVGGATYQVPVEVDEQRGMALAMRWLVKYARERGEKSMMYKLSGEIMDAADEEGGSRGKGGAIKKREDMHRMAEANKPFAHYRW